MLVLYGIGDEFRRDGAEFNRSVRHALRRLEDFRILHFTGSDGPHNLGHDAGFEVVVQDVAAGEADAAGAYTCKLRMRSVKAGHVPWRVACPGLPADVLIESAVAVG